MGLTNASTGHGAIDNGFSVTRRHPDDKIVALAGNPNVGKSTVFNGLTGMHQHTGNWSGKTVTNAQGTCQTALREYTLVDIPGTYSLMAHSAEEEVARNFICFGEPDAVVVVCDATCLERNLNLVLQTMEMASSVIVCVNLMDEAKRKHITVDLEKLAERLGVPVISTVARDKASLQTLLDTLDRVTEDAPSSHHVTVHYPMAVESAIAELQSAVAAYCGTRLNSRWVSLQLLGDDHALKEEICRFLGADLQNLPALTRAQEHLQEAGLDPDTLKDGIVSSLVGEAERLCRGVVRCDLKTATARDRRIDRVLTGKWIGYPLMIVLLALVFWFTISGANYPSALLSDGLFWVQDRLTDLFRYWGAPEWLHGLLVLGMYRVLAWVVSVMLPPMAIFFPLFTLLEEVGYLPRIAYNLDRPFQRCKACGKQALTMSMGFGCNAAGIVGCRIIDSPRERLLAILTNNFVPCNGRFPALIAILTMFFVGTAGGLRSSVISAGLLTLLIVLGVLITFGVTRLLSETVLRGIPSSFTLELPPYRRPQIGKVIVRSVFDRTLFVLGRAAAVAAPAGMLLWMLANVTVGDSSLLQHAADFLDPFAQLMGLDGVILIAFILGFPANEIVIPIIIMAYTAQGSLLEMNSLTAMRDLFIQNGWTVTTAICTMLFTLLHFPCSTTMLTIRKETGSSKWTAFAMALPTGIGILACMLCNAILSIFE